MSSNVPNNLVQKPICAVSLCGKEADWRLELFGKVEYYCQRHRPGVPEAFMAKVDQS